MSRVQLAINVRDIDKAIAFYSELFDAQPAKVKPGYANFAIAEPPLKLVLIENPLAEGGSLNHLGVEVEETAQVDQAAARLRDSGLVTLEERDTACCYAVQDKVWVADPDGARWEVYTVKEDSELFAEVDEAGDATCCGEVEASAEPAAAACC